MDLINPTLPLTLPIQTKADINDRKIFTQRVVESWAEGKAQEKQKMLV